MPLLPSIIIALSCPSEPVLSRLQRYSVTKTGETLTTIAQIYNLSPQTLERFNPNLGEKVLPINTTVTIPPVNGMPIQAPEGSSWQDLSNYYGIRADVLFELNGCQKKPSVVFIPSFSNQTLPVKPKVSNYTGFSGYPLPKIAKIGLSYGWQNKKFAQKDQGKFFQSGIDLLADFNSPVLAVDNGTVVYAGVEKGYGKLIIINYNGVLQSRYAQLNQIKVKIGSSVKAGQVIATVGVSGDPDITPTHLHFEVRLKQPVGWISQDPMLYLVQKTQ